MNFYLKNYHSGPRLARVTLEKPQENFPYEQLVLQEHGSYFSSDEVKITPEQMKRMRSLQDGDIIIIQQNGIIHRVYSKVESEATVYLTGHCNSNCVMCPTSDRERRESNGMADDWLAQYIDMLPYTIRNITVTGGEPTLRLQTFFQIMQRLAYKFPTAEVLLLSNGRSFSSSKLLEKLLSACPPYLRVAIPLHGDTAGLHDTITRVKGSFKQTSYGIKNLLQAGISVEIRIVVSKLNCQHLNQMAELILNEFPAVSVVNFIGLETRGNCACNFSMLYLDHKQIFLYMKPAINQLLQAGIVTNIYNFPLCNVEAGYWDLCRRSISPEKIRYCQECENCEMKSECGGFFNTTISMAKPKVNPIHLQGEKRC